MIDSSSYYKIYKERIEKAIKNNDAKLLEDVKQAVMWAPSTKLLPSESRELWKMIKSATFKDGTSTLNDAVYSINIYSSNPDKLSSFCNTYLSTCKNAKDEGKGKHPVYGGYVNIGGLSSADVLHLKEMAKSWASISIHLSSKVGDSMDLRVVDENGCSRSVADGNLGEKPLKIGQTVHLDPSNITKGKLSEEDLKAEYEIKNFYFKQESVSVDPTLGEQWAKYRSFSGVRIKNKKTGISFDVNRFQLMDGDTSDIDKMDKYALAYRLAKYGIEVNESNPKSVAEMRKLLKEKMSQKDSKMFKVTDKNTGVVRLARAADGLDAVRKVAAVKDAGLFSLEVIKINSASEISLAKIVSDVKKVAHPKLVAEITNGRLDGNSLALQLLVRKDFNGGFTWMEMPIMYELNFDAANKLYSEGGFNLKKALSEIREKLKQFVGKQLYKDRTLVTDAKLMGVVKDEDSDSDLIVWIFECVASEVVKRLEFLRSLGLSEKDWKSEEVKGTALRVMRYRVTSKRGIFKRFAKKF